MTDFIKHPPLEVFNSALVKSARFSARYEFPLLERTHFVPDRAIPFEKASKASNHQQWVHFYTHDRQFECVWRNPKQYLAMFQRFEGVITPDYSLYREMPLAMQIWNTYRNRALAYWLQHNGVKIVPNVRWGDERTHAFAFEGLMSGGIRGHQHKRMYPGQNRPKVLSKGTGGDGEGVKARDHHQL